MKHYLRSKRVSLVLFGLLIFIFAVGLIWSIVSHVTTGNKSTVTTSIAVPRADSSRGVKDIVTNANGDLIITYSDGTTQNAGHVVGVDGEDGQLPTRAQISAALLEYCANGQCDAKLPTQQQILDSITSYCLNGVCKGTNGVDAEPVTTDQILLAVNAYCTNGRCVGPAGATGATGSQGETTVMSCVTRPLNNLTANYVAWRYTSEPDTSYRNLYKLPAWASCENPVVLSS